MYYYPQAQPSDSGGQLTDAISGDRVHNPALDLEKMVSAQETYFQSPLFDKEKMEFVWAYNEPSYSFEIQILSQASGHLAIRWNAGDDLYLASGMASDRIDGNEPFPTIYRVGWIRMQAAPRKLRVSWGSADDIDPDNKDANVPVYGKRSDIFIEQLKNQTTAQIFLVLARPLNTMYQRTEETKLYVKCPQE